MKKTTKNVERFFVLTSAFSVHGCRNEIREVRVVFSGKEPINEIEEKPGIRTVFYPIFQIQSDYHHGSSPFKPYYLDKDEIKTHRFIIGSNIRIAKKQDDEKIQYQTGSDVSGLITGLFLDEWTAVGASLTPDLYKEHHRNELLRCSCEVLSAVENNLMFAIDGSDESGAGRFMCDDFWYKWRQENLPKK
ncbi:MAG: hypothetical protein WAV11_03825 [Minisyncoccia bacterium]